jgi:UDP-N-acetylmuramoyl-tripeptide--D-alanyl-D-alanine ligase
MAAAINSFFELKTSKKILILGDMLELGDKSEEEHLKLLETLKSLKPEKVFLVGSTFQKISAGTDIKSFHDVEKLREYLKTEPLKGSLILIKGSRGMTLEKIYDLL